MAMQSNLAYDFERFETQRRAPEQKPKLRVVEKKRQARQTRYFVMKAAACITVFFLRGYWASFSARSRSPR